MSESPASDDELVHVDVAYVQTVLGSNVKDVTPGRLAGVLAAERLAQRRVCTIRADGLVPADLAGALVRRVARNLAMQGVPLAIQVGELGPVRLGANDPEIARLERPHERAYGMGVG